MRRCLLPALLLLVLSRDAQAKRTQRPSAVVGTPAKEHAAAGFWFAVNHSTSGVEVQDEDCARIHEFKDKCAFVHKNCQDERVGFFDYLDLYYCRLDNAHGIAFAILATWLGMLFTTIGIAASDFFCVNLSTIASLLGMSESMAGVTFLAFGNGSPDVFSTFAAMKVGSGSLAVGELIGAASFITAVVAGSMAIVRPFKVGRKSFVRDVCFFMVSVVFGMVFLVDGKIEMWECIVMVLLYVFYVIFVVVWHWVSMSKKRRRQKERQAREHHLDTGDQDLLLDPEEEDDEDGRMGEEAGLLDGDIGALERANDDESPEEDMEEREQEAYAEISSNMRVSRPSTVRTMTPATPHAIRPSLVGALEFRAVLHSLRKNQNLGGRQIHLRSYSDDGIDNMQRRSALGSLLRTDGAADMLPEPSTPSSLLRPEIQGNRHRAVSVNDASHYTVNTENFPPYRNTVAPEISLPENFKLIETASQDDGTNSDPNWDPPIAERDPLTLRIPTTDLLAPPASGSAGQSPISPLSKAIPHLLITDSDNESAGEQILFESPRPVTRTASPTGSIHLPAPSINSSVLSPGAHGWVPLKYWPYHLLPPPQMFFETLFPTLCGFIDKSLGEQVLAVIFVPAVFFLTITLPVVDGAGVSPEKHDANLLLPESPTTPTTLPSSQADSTPAPTEPIPGPPSGKEWNRWLVAIQCITAPLFIVVMLFADDGGKTLARATLYALIVGLIALGLLLTTTSPNTRPRYHYLLCFAGFAVSISWISTVAEEVVGVLKAFGVILGISDAILGLTIFAVGNSLGDLVADITVARLGFPVMALSACFGGPMLNILLGVGLSGLYMTLANGAKGEPYKIEVSSTLVISAATLLLTLCVLLIWVPFNKWMMSRRIGWTIVAMWAISTVINVAVEVTGVGGTWA